MVQFFFLTKNLTLLFHSWEPSEEMLKVEGVTNTVAGYTGNPEATRAPTYDSVCFGDRWVEAVRVTYDD